MTIEPAFKYTIAKTPEWEAWERQLEIDGDNNIIRSLKAGIITSSILASYINFASQQKAIQLLLECQSVISINHKEMNTMMLLIDRKKLNHE